MSNAEISIDMVHRSKNILLAVRSAIADCQSDLERHHALLSDPIRGLDELLSAAPTDYIPQAWKVLRTGLSILTAHGKCLSIAHGATGDLTAEQARLEILFREFQGQLSAAAVWPASLAALRRELCGNPVCDARRVAGLLLALPVPLLYWLATEDGYSRMAGSQAVEQSTCPLVRVIAFLDDAPVATPQLVKPGILYGLSFRVRGIEWPTGATSLRLALVSTCPHEEYSVSTFILPRPTALLGAQYEGYLPGHIRFHSAQSTILEDIVYGLRAAFELPGNAFQDVPIIGHHELRLRVVSYEAHPLMGGNRFLDRHIEELVLTLINECPRAKDELADLLPMIQALNRLLATYSQEAIYKGATTVAENDFHATVLRDLRFQLGQDVQSHPHQAGGISDIRYRGVIVELKVERDNGDRKHICRKYTAQAVQYSGVEARQVSTVLVLDLTEKHQPPSDIRNDVLLVDVPTHGGSDQQKSYPAKAFVFVINGNVKSPSDYS